MNQLQKNEVKELLQIIELKKSIHEREMAALRKRLIQYAAYFETYSEMYYFIRRNTQTYQQFCQDMFEAIPIFYEAQERRGE